MQSTMCFCDILSRQWWYNNCSSFSFSSYIIENGVCFLTLTDKTFSKRAAFSFLEELSSEFHREFGHKIATATRPYSFIEFGEHLPHTTVCCDSLVKLLFASVLSERALFLIQLSGKILPLGSVLIRWSLFKPLMLS